MNEKNFVKDAVAKHQASIWELQKAVWEAAELGYEEVKSAAAFCRSLKEAGFTVESGVAEIPTAFIGTYGSGKPVIGILAEFDALSQLGQEAACPVKTPTPDNENGHGPTAFIGTYGSGKPVIGILAEFDALSQLGQEAACPVKTPTPDNENGHGCGHSALGAGAFAAAVAVKDYLDATGCSGTVKLFGCPAEETGYGKTFMTRYGCFDGVDAVFTWHPFDNNAAWGVSCQANINMTARPL